MPGISPDKIVVSAWRFSGGAGMRCGRKGVAYPEGGG